MNEDWKQTELYRQGMFHARLGKILMNPKSRISDIATLAFDYKLEPSFIFKAIDSMDSEQGDNNDSL